MKMGRFIFIFTLIFHLLYLKDVFCVDNGSGEAENESGSGEDDTETDDPTFTDIIDLSIRQIITSNDAKRDGEILDKYYFTDKKKISIWPKIIKETEKTTNEEFEERELADMENAVKNIYRRMLECDLNTASQKDKKDKAKDLVRCYKTLNEFIADGFVDFSYPRGTMRGHAHMFEMNMAYNVMVLLIYHMISSMSLSAKLDSFSTQIQFYKIAEGFVESIDIVSKNSIDVRLSAISPIEICEIQEVLWQEFTGQCESRVKREIDKVHGIGGSANVFQQKYRAKVTDDITGKEICYKEETSSTTKNSKKMKTELTKVCFRKRESYINKIRKEITEYYNERASAVTKDLPKLWGSDKLKLTKVKEELEQREKNRGKEN